MELKTKSDYIMALILGTAALRVVDSSYDRAERKGRYKDDES